MPLSHRIDHERRIVVATASGALADAEIFGYQHTVWSRPEVEGYDELIDMRQISSIEFKSIDRVRQLARLAADMDVGGKPCKLAIVAGEDLHYGLGRMYQAYREAQPHSMKETRIFRTRDEADAWLGLHRQPLAAHQHADRK